MMIKKRIIKNFNFRDIVNLAVESLLYEVSIFPKAGLVTKYSNGSHKDMDYLTFQRSAYSLKEYFIDCFKHSEKFSIQDDNFFLELREIGKKAEKRMFEATNGINTHKGTIFSLGILIAVVSSCIKNKKIFLEDVSNEIKRITKILEKELESNSEKTNGEKIYKKYRIKGARGLALSGYSIVLLDGIEKLYVFLKKLDLETSCILLLFYYISEIDDTNIINRSNIKKLEEVKKISKKLYEKNKCKLLEKNIKKDMYELDKKFIKENISPGGSADLLILTIFIYFITA